jgi:hypothetical protein
MKKEYKERLDKMREFFINYDDIPDDDFYRRRLEFDDHLEVLAATKDTEVLEHLLDFFDEEFDCEVNEACEHLKAEIGANFTLDQIIEALYKKFDSFAENYLGMCVQISWHMFSDENFEEFREMFSAVKSQHSEKFLQKMYDWAPESTNYADLLRNDMKKW